MLEFYGARRLVAPGSAGEGVFGQKDGAAMTQLPSARRRKLHTVIGGVIVVAWCVCIVWALCMALYGLAEALR